MTENDPYAFLDDEDDQSGETATKETGTAEGEKIPAAESTTGASATAPTPEEIFGEEYKSWDKVKAEFPARLAQLKELDTLKQEKSDLETKLGQGPAFANENVAGFNNFVAKTGIENFSIYERIKTASIEDPIEALITQKIIESPELLGKEALIRAKIEKDFGVDPKLFTEEEIALNITDVKKAATGAIETIYKLKEGAKYTPAATPKPEETLADWKPVVKQELSSMTSIPIPSGEKDEQGNYKKLMDFEVPESVKNEYEEYLSGIFARTGKVNADSQKLVKNEFWNRYVTANFPSIVKAIDTKLRTEIETEFEAKYKGMGGLKEPGGKGSQTNVDSAYDEEFGPI